MSQGFCPLSARVRSVAIATKLLYTNQPRHRALLVTPPCSGAACGTRAVHQGAPELGLTVMAHASGVLLTLPGAICVQMVLFVQICVRMHLTPGGISTYTVGKPLTGHAQHGREASGAALVVLLGAAGDWSGDGRLGLESRLARGRHNAQARTRSSARDGALVRFRDPPHVVP